MRKVNNDAALANDTSHETQRLPMFKILNLFGS
jgi:hypothetical protein